MIRDTSSKSTNGGRAPTGRRTFLETLLAAGAGLAVARPSNAAVRASQVPDSSADKPALPLPSTPLTPSVTVLHVDDPSAGSGSPRAESRGANVVVINGSDGVWMVNGGPRERSNHVLRAVNALASAPYVRGLFNTDWHLEHTGCNDALGQARTRIVAHANTKLWMGTAIVQEWQQRTYPPRQPIALPTQTFYTSGSITFGRERIEYGYLPQAHTDGDIYVRLRDANIIVAGDVVSAGRYPVLDYTTGGWIGGLADATKTLLDLSDRDTRIIPGSGPVLTREHLEAQHAMCSEVRARLVDLLKKGMSARDMIAAAPTRDFDATWGSPDLFIANAYKGLWGHVRELGGIV